MLVERYFFFANRVQKCTFRKVPQVHQKGKKDKSAAKKNSVKFENFNLAAIKRTFIRVFISPLNMNETHYRLISPRNIRLRRVRQKKKKERRGEKYIFLNLKRENPLQCVRATIIYSLASDASVFLSRLYFYHGLISA